MHCQLVALKSIPTIHLFPAPKKPRRGSSVPLSEGDTYCGLAALGPGTEAISEGFLIPLEVALQRAFADRRVRLPILRRS